MELNLLELRFPHNFRVVYFKDFLLGCFRMPDWWIMDILKHHLFLCPEDTSKPSEPLFFHTQLSFTDRGYRKENLNFLSFLFKLHI